MSDAPLANVDRGSARDAISARLRSARVLRGCDDAFLRVLAAGSSIHRVPKGERFWMRGEPALHFNQVMRGVLELRRATAGQDPTIIALFGPGECPAVPVALERRRYIADSYATADLEVLRIPAEPILERMQNDVQLALNVNRMLLDHARLLHSKIDVLTAGAVPHRIALFLLDLGERFGDEREDGSLAIPLTLTRGQIASYVDARVETVIRCFSAWRRQGLLVLEPDATVIPDAAKLRTTVFADA